MDPFIHNWIFLPFLIFVARMCDVTLGTMRHVLIARGMKKVVPFLGFFEVLIWLIAIGQIMKNLENVMCYIAWASGFAMGNYIGMMIEEKIALGLQVVRVITNQSCDEFLNQLNKANMGATVMNGTGAKGPVKIIFTVLERKNIPSFVQILSLFNPDAFYSIEDVRAANKGVFQSKMNVGSKNYNIIRRMFPTTKGK